MKISASLEDYLNAIYTLNPENSGVRLTDVSEYLDVKKSSTNSALNILKEQGLVNYEKYKNVTLTDIGIVQAKHIKKRLELFRKFLVDIIGTDEKLASVEADKLAHCISCHTTAKFEKFIEKELKVYE